MFAEQIEGRVAVIGDVHGHAEKLNTILQRLQAIPDFDERWIVFVGDLVDRGPQSREVLDMVADLVENRVRVTACTGNHDFAMAASLGLIPTPEYSNWAGRWLDHYSAETTFESYGVPFGDLAGLRSAMPKAHQELIAKLPWSVEHSHYFFVHAGLDSHTPFEMQKRILRQKDYSLNRPQWFCEKRLVHADVPVDCPFSVVSGHVEVQQVIINRKRVLCDTSGGRGGDLSCVLLPENLVVTSGSQQQVPQKTAQGTSKPWWKMW